MQLARWLAQQGIQTHYWYSRDIGSPKGDLQLQPRDPSNLSIKAIGGNGEVKKYAPIMRLKQELIYANALAAQTRALAPTVALSNAPPHIQATLRQAVQERGRFVLWMQDIYSLALHHLLARKSPLLANLVMPLARGYENAQLRKSDAVVCISEDFRTYCERFGVRRDRSVVIENWAALEDLPALSKDNAWSCAQGLEDKFVFLFSGTLGLKHDPEIFVLLAQSLREVPQAVCVVVSEGAGRDFLEMRKQALNLSNLRLYDYQKHGDFPQLLASGDVLVAILEPFASQLSAPSKVLAYFCAGRPLLAAIPESNHSAQLIHVSGGGLLVSPGDNESFLRAAHTLMKDGPARQRYGQAARNFAEKTFDMDRIGRRFLSTFEAAKQ
jgi:colanic acid biosynthesis glycosyl transferase WcaI